MPRFSSLMHTPLPTRGFNIAEESTEEKKSHNHIIQPYFWKSNSFNIYLKFPFLIIINIKS